MEAQAAPAPAKGGGSSMMPILLAVVLVPALCFATTHYLLVPKLRSAVIESGGGEVSAKPEEKSAAKHHGAEAGGHAKKSDKGKSEAEHDAEFGTVIVNVAGANGSRYLRTNLVVVSGDPKIPEVVKENMSALRDAAINVLSAQPLSVLDSAGGKNLVRTELITAFNRTLGGEVVGQIYFSEFVVQ